MLDRTIHAFIFSFTASATLVACNLDSAHCIGDCMLLTAGSETTGSAATTAESTSTTTGSTTAGDGAPTTTASPETTAATTGSGSGHYTCRDATVCLVQCELVIPEPTPPSYDPLSCFLMCIEKLPDEEWDKLNDLRECVHAKCAMTTACAEEEQECQQCRLIGLGDATPEPGDPCEAEAKACE